MNSVYSDEVASEQKNAPLFGAGANQKGPDYILHLLTEVQLRQIPEFLISLFSDMRLGIALLWTIIATVIYALNIELNRQQNLPGDFLPVSLFQT